MRSMRTDLAVEAHEYYVGDGKNVPSGIEVRIEDKGGVKITRVEVTSQSGAETINKPIGNYITIEAEGLSEDDEEAQHQASQMLAEEISRLLIENGVGADEEVLVVGLGNWDITPDALGPKTISKLNVTRHLFEYMPGALEKGVRPVCAMSPGVLGTTGIETGEMVKGISDKTTPRAVIAIDALASRSLGRLGTTIQIADTGICPGSGVGNSRKELSRESLGIPVIAIGVPTVVDAATVADDALEATLEALKSSSTAARPFYEMLMRIGEDNRYNLIRETLGNRISSMIVTPKEVDGMIENISDVIAEGINIGLHSVAQ